MKQLLENVDVTAVMAASDLMAIGAMRQLLASGVAVPDDMSVAGVDDIPIAEYGPVPLTTMRVPTYEIGRQGASLLLEALAGGTPDDVLLTARSSNVSRSPPSRQKDEPLLTVVWLLGTVPDSCVIIGVIVCHRSPEKADPEESRLM